MGLSLRDAADHTGTRPSTILRAVLSGRLSYDRDSEGSYLFDPEELETVFAPARRIEPVPLTQMRIVPALPAPAPV
jgi:hypothetical protein